MSEQNNADISPVEMLVRTTLAGSLTSFNPNIPADSQREEISQYLSMMQSGNRNFHNLAYIAKCLILLKSVPKILLGDIPHVIAALLFHKVYYDPRNIHLSIRRSCEIAMVYYPGDKTVTLFSLIKATRFGASINHRYDDDRAYIADISFHMYGLPWDEFRKAWGLVLQEFESANYKPVRFKKLTAKQLRKMIVRAERFGLFQTNYFREKFESQAVSNLHQLLDEVSL